MWQDKVCAQGTNWAAPAATTQHSHRSMHSTYLSSAKSCNSQLRNSSTVQNDFLRNGCTTTLTNPHMQPRDSDMPIQTPRLFKCRLHSSSSSNNKKEKQINIVLYCIALCSSSIPPACVSMQMQPNNITQHPHLVLVILSSVVAMASTIKCFNSLRPLQQACSTRTTHTHTHTHTGHRHLNPAVMRPGCC
jgi:hypothetical protein